MKDIPIWARWNGQEVMAIHRDPGAPGAAGWHTYYLRRGAHGAPLPRVAELLTQGVTWLLQAAGKPWRRLRALRQAQG